MKIFTVNDDVDTVYVTRSESKAAKWMEEIGTGGWIVESPMDTYLGTSWYCEVIWTNLEEFRKEHNV